MASVPLDQNGDCIDDIPVGKILPPDCGEAEASLQILSDSYDAGDAFGEPDILPRIGDEYQAELPPLIGESNCLPYSRNYTDTEVRAHPHQNFFAELPIPLTWTSSLKHEGPEIVSDTRHPNSKNVIMTGTYFNGEIESSHDSVKPKEKIRKCSGEGRLLVPGLLSECWSGAEEASFILGLYIFEKNFVEVRQFIETKEMGEMLSYYYGTFYGSAEYIRWSERQKTKSKKCVFGQKIFSGLRQQELLCRLVPRVSEECRSALLEVSKTFADEKMSLVDYVSSLKAMVGMNILVEAVGIGTGKQDLTGMAFEPLRSNQVIPVRPDIPTGKACSSLTTTEIIKFLGGDYRLSKARSNDLFWEAVWPRLLARGWHSEQPKSQGNVAGSKHCLVFLMPGVKKFSRRKLVKGDHYFDSVTDVLSKVAKEPGLIELDNEEANGCKNKEEHEWTNERKSKEDGNGLPTRQRHFYLQPRTQNRSMHAIKFTVVDTSLSNGKMRDLRTLPSEISNTLISLDCIEDSDQNILEEKTGESDTINTIILHTSVTDNQTAKSGEKMLPGRKNHDDNSSYQDTHNVYPDITKTSVPDLKNKDLNDNKKFRKVLSSRKQKQGNIDDKAPIGKRCRRLTANSHEETRDGAIHSSTAPRLDNGMSSRCSGIHDFNENLSSQVSSWQDKLSSTSSSKGSPSESMECATISNIHATEPSLENPQTRLLIDLNLPASPEFENGVLATDLSKEQDNQSPEPENHSLPNFSDIEARSEQHSNVNTQRHSTRNRPPTTRALEAIADGYLTVNQRRRGRATSSREDLASRPSQRARGVVGPNESSNSYTASQTEEAGNGVSSSGNYNMASKLQVPPEGK
ncbi:hypothetical protein Pfo_015940 [Paulownia fortunei]|nr:hypothetical protein Pfo_015940 [Paulownia fortunei]